MLNDEEFDVIRRLYSQAFQSLKSATTDLQPGASLIEAALAPVRDEYFRMTGFRETNTAAILHHHLSIYGPACLTCGKPLRTPQATFCAACGARVNPERVTQGW